MGESPIDTIKAKALEGTIIEVLRTVYDPELPVNIYDLGLIYGLDVSADGHVIVRMTLTTPACPVAGVLLEQVEVKVKSVADVSSAKVELVWDPPWTKEQMTEAAKLHLGLDVEIPPQPIGSKLPGYHEEQ